MSLLLPTLLCPRHADGSTTDGIWFLLIGKSSVLRESS